MTQHDQGILNGTTAFGKTVTAIGLIAERKVKSLIYITGTFLRKPPELGNVYVSVIYGQGWGLRKIYFL
ncbi:hypothetical protein [Bacteroides pyogenes]|uniref:hypothetical protein n=1 Tax=Bacteroides pyogenes TaxID=310300 RepID=UPI002FDA0B1B